MCSRFLEQGLEKPADFTFERYGRTTWLPVNSRKCRSPYT